MVKNLCAAMRFSSHNRRIFTCLSLIFLAVFFCTSFSNLHAETKDAEQMKQQRIAEIQKKVVVLKLEREQLARSLKEDRKKESKEEMQSMHKMQTYRWHAAAEDLKDAEQIENKSNEKHKKITEMDQQLYELEKEMDRLTGSGS